MDDSELERLQGVEQRRWRRHFIAVSAFALGMVLAGIGFSLGDADGGEPYRPFQSFLIGLGVFVVLGGLVAMMLFRPNDETKRLRAAGSPRDRLQSQRAEQILILPATSLYLTFKGTQGAWSILEGRGDGYDWAFALLGSLMSVTVLVMVAGLDNPGDRRMKRLLDDELVRSFRHRSLTLGFMVLVVGFLGAFAAALWRPAAGITAMPLVLAVAAGAAAIRFAWLNHEADPHG